MWRFNVATRRPERIPNDDDEASTSDERGPTCFDTTEFGKFLDVGKDKLNVRYTGNGLHDNDVGSIQANAMVPRRQLVYYYELTVLHAGERGAMSIGFAEKGFKLGRHPGWEPNSYGYHSEDGRKLTGVVTPSRSGGEEYGPPWGAGDTVGAGILLESQEMFFTHNGKSLGTAFRNVLKVPLYPTVGLHSRKEHVKVNFGREPFAFDVASLLAAERGKREAAVQTVRVASGDTHQLVRDFLLHHGYEGTLRAFVDSAGLAQPGGGRAGGGDAAASTSAAEASLPLRAQLRTLIQGGRVEAAHALLRARGAVPRDRQPGLDVYFFCQCLAFIELVARGDTEAAVAAAQSTLSPLRCILAGKSGAYDAMLADTVALLAYPDPHASPLRRLLSQAQREAVADMVNSAVLEEELRRQEEAAARQAGTEPPARPTRGCQSALERSLHQLVAVQHELHAANGGHGQVFRLQDHLRPPSARILPEAQPANGTTHANGFGHH